MQEQEACIGTKEAEENNGRSVRRDGLDWQKNPDAASMAGLGCQNSSGCSTIVKLSAFKKMEEITHSLCLWEETVIAIDL